MRLIDNPNVRARVDGGGRWDQSDKLAAVGETKYRVAGFIFCADHTPALPRATFFGNPP